MTYARTTVSRSLLGLDYESDHTGLDDGPHHV